MAKGRGRMEQAGNGKTVHYLSRGGNKPAKRGTSKTIRQKGKKEARHGKSDT